MVGASEIQAVGPERSELILLTKAKKIRSRLVYRP